MTLKPIASNMTELDLNGTTILFSYSTPVAAYIGSPAPGNLSPSLLAMLREARTNFIRTEDKFSRTTSSHINKWLKRHGANLALPVPQSTFALLTNL